jgi:anti-sigma B factor antagonist
VNFSAKIRQQGEISLVDLSGPLTSFETAALQETFAGLLRQGRKRIILNLRGLEYLDSSGVGQLVRTYLMVVKAGGEMRAVGLTPRIEEILKITKLSQVFPEFPDEEEALRSFR